MLQYIGARYVPIFYQNSQDPTSSIWEMNVTYEPMTWVSLANGHMYISKKTVPANIGSPVDNGEYWLEAGQYNAYIQTLQDQIDNMNDGSVSGSLQNQINNMQDGNVSGSLQDQINDMKDGSISGSLQDQINDMKDGSISGSLQDQINDANVDIGKINTIIKKLRQHSNSNVIVIGDSWGTGSYGVQGYESTLPAQFTGENLYMSCQGGYAWNRSGLKFLTLLQNIDVPDPNKIDLVIVAGGVNDASQNSTVAEIGLAMRDLTDYVNSTFPNAIVIGVGLNCHYAYNAIDQRVKLAGNTNNGYLGKFYYVDYTNVIPPAWFTSDGVHLVSLFAYKCVGQLIAGIIQGIITPNITLDDSWAVTRYSSTLKEDGNSYIDISQRKVNGKREIKIKCHSSSGDDFYTFNTNISAAGVVTYFNFGELVSGIDFLMPEKLPLPFFFRKTSTDINFNGHALGSFDVRGVGQANNALHLDFISNQAMPYTVQRIAFPTQTFTVSW